MRRGASALLAAGALIACRDRTPPDAAPGLAAPPTAPAPSPTTLYPAAPSAFVDLVKEAREGVVAIRATTKVKSGPAAMFPGAPESSADEALGTGFLIEIEHKGSYVLTTDHIASAAPELKVVLADRSEVPARVQGRDARLDLALLAVDVARPHVLVLGDSDDLKVGEWVLALGDPFGDEVTAAAGMLSATGRAAAGSMVEGKTSMFRTFLQTDARIHRGNSGGPVLNTAGEVVGMAVATGDRPGELGFVLPANRIREIAPSLRDYGSVARSWLGAKVLPVTQALATQFHLDKARGALITSVEPGSPAIKAGLQPGDIVLRWNKADVDSSTLHWAVMYTPVGKTIEAIVWRSSAEHSVAVTAEKMPE